MPAIEYLALYSTNCKRCHYLDPQEPKKFTRCHFSKGNTDCPATEIRIVIAGKATRMAHKVVEARKNRDSVAEAAIFAALVSESAAFQSRFYDDLESICPKKS